jgi:hypothetical protein
MLEPNIVPDVSDMCQTFRTFVAGSIQTTSGRVFVHLFFNLAAVLRYAGLGTLAQSNDFVKNIMITGRSTNILEKSVGWLRKSLF